MLENCRIFRKIHEKLIKGEDHNMEATAGGLALGIPIFLILFYFALFGLSIYCFILFIKLAHRGIKALDIYINERNNRNL